jgi:ABC-type transporter Mla subunit MlaD
MSNEIIRKNLVDAINEMSRLLEVCEDEDQLFEIRMKIRELSLKLDRVIVAILNSETPEFKEALASLKTLTNEAREAKNDLKKTASAINKAAEALGKVEKLLKGVSV